LSKEPDPKATREARILPEDDASKLSNELKEKLLMGTISEADQDLIELIIAGLGDKRGSIRRTFTEILGAIGHPAVPALRNALLHHSNVTVRRSAAKALKLVGDPSALPDLLKALINDEDPVVQGSSAGAMAIFGEEGVRHLLKVLVNPSSTAMQCGLATWGLSFVGAEAPNALREAAQSENVVIKAAAIAALGEQIQCLGDKIAKDLVIQALDDSAIEVRVEATILLGKLHDLRWVKPLLIEKLFDENADVKMKAALSLMKLKEKEAIDELQKLSLIEKDSRVVDILELAINELRRI